MSTYQTRLADIVERDPRYTYEAYEFVFAALGHTQQLLGRVPSEDELGDPGPEYHVSGRELVQGIRDLALRDFGLMLGALTLARLASIYDPPGLPRLGR